MEMTGQKKGGGFADWVLNQRKIEIRDATIVWLDEMRGAPQLELKSVRLQIVNRGDDHQFGLRAVPPEKLAGPLDVRGHCHRHQCHGDRGLEREIVPGSRLRRYRRVARLGALPDRFSPAAPAVLRTWLTFAQDRLTDAIVDLRLANVRTRLDKNLPELDVTELSGRLGWKMSGSGFEVTTTALKLTTAGGLTLPPDRFSAAVQRCFRYAAGTRRDQRQRARFRAARGARGSSAVPADARKQLAEHSPKGHLQDVQVRWTGDWRNPSQYSAKGKFAGLAMTGAGKVPGFEGVSGTIEGTERGGTLQLNTQNAGVDMPLVFREPLHFDVLSAQLAWSRADGETEIRLNNISFSNSHLAGNVLGTYRTMGTTRGNIDLTGSLTRADARYASRYIPLVIGQRARDWFDVAFVSGQSNDVSLRLKGNLNEFPFADGQSGVFQVVARVTEGTIEYANGWPRMENVAGDLLFRGKRMEVNARQATILGGHLGPVQAEIPDLLDPEKLLVVTGEAEGPTREFFTFIEKSPINGMIDHFTDNWQAQGSGKLTLKLELAAPRDREDRVSGTYEFAGNTVVTDPDLPAIEQASGRVEFTESSVRAQGITGTFIGGPLTISASSQKEGAVRIAAQGRLSADNVRRAGNVPPWLQGCAVPPTGARFTRCRSAYRTWSSNRTCRDWRWICRHRSARRLTARSTCATRGAPPDRVRSGSSWGWAMS
jgi:uncharacterized protein YhdP